MPHTEVSILIKTQWLDLIWYIYEGYIVPLFYFQAWQHMHYSVQGQAEFITLKFMSNYGYFHKCNILLHAVLNFYIVPFSSLMAATPPPPQIKSLCLCQMQYAKCAMFPFLDRLFWVIFLKIKNILCVRQNNVLCLIN